MFIMVDLKIHKIYQKNIKKNIKKWSDTGRVQKLLVAIFWGRVLMLNRESPIVAIINFLTIYGVIYGVFYV